MSCLLFKILRFLFKYVHAMLQTVCYGFWELNPCTGRAESTFNPQVISSDPRWFLLSRILLNIEGTNEWEQRLILLRGLSYRS